MDVVIFEHLVLHYLESSMLKCLFVPRGWFLLITFVLSVCLSLTVCCYPLVVSCCFENPPTKAKTVGVLLKLTHTR